MQQLNLVFQLLRGKPIPFLVATKTFFYNMSRYLRFLILAGLFAVSTEPIYAQAPLGFDSNSLGEIQEYVGLPDSLISQQFGQPDEIGFEEGKQAVVWTYITKITGETAGTNSIAGYHQFAFWNGKVAGYRTRRFTDEEQAIVMYDSTLAFMKEDGRTIARGGNADSTMFTENLRISRRGDNIWQADMLKDAFNSHATIIVGDVGYRSCERVVKTEAKRIEKKFGIEVTEEGKIDSQ